MKKKQLFAVLLAGSMTVGMAPAAAFAAEDTGAVTEAEAPTADENTETPDDGAAVDDQSQSEADAQAEAEAQAADRHQAEAEAQAAPGQAEAEAQAAARLRRKQRPRQQLRLRRKRRSRSSKLLRQMQRLLLRQNFRQRLIMHLILQDLLMIVIYIHLLIRF